MFVKNIHKWPVVVDGRIVKPQEVIEINDKKAEIPAIKRMLSGDVKIGKPLLKKVSAEEAKKPEAKKPAPKKAEEKKPAAKKADDKKKK